MLWKYFSYFPLLVSRMWRYFLKFSTWESGGILGGEIYKNLDYGPWGFSFSHMESPAISWSDNVFQPGYDSRGFCSRFANIDCNSLCLPISTESRWYFVLNSLMGLIKVITFLFVRLFSCSDGMITQSILYVGAEIWNPTITS